jgi:hypothetical protein
MVMEPEDRPPTERSRADGPRRTGYGPDRRSREFYRQIRVVSLAVFLPMIMVVGPVAGYFGGGWIGERLGSAPLGRVLGLVAGAIAGVHQTIHIIRRILRELK